MFISSAITGIGGIVGFLLSSQKNTELANTIRKISTVGIVASLVFGLFAQTSETMRESCMANSFTWSCGVFLGFTAVLWVASAAGCIATIFYVGRNYFDPIKDASSSRSHSS
jgi:hypothetical protein